MGFVPHDQEDFFKAMREMIETHKKEQQAKQQQQKMVRLLYYILYYTSNKRLFIYQRVFLGSYFMLSLSS
jgi:hypothetical protein